MTGLSRVSGFLRDILLSYLFGASALMLAVRDGLAVPVDWILFDPVFQDRELNVTLTLLAVRYTAERLGKAVVIDVSPGVINSEVAAEVKRGVVAAGFEPERMHELAGLAEVGKLLEELAVDSRDLILFENDLPDLYE